MNQPQATLPMANVQQQPPPTVLTNQPQTVSTGPASPIVVAPPDISDPASLQQWLNAQQRAYEAQVAALKRISGESKVESVNIIKSTEYLTSVERIEKIRFIMLIFTIISILLFFIYTYMSIRSRFSVMIESIDATIAAGQYSGPSGWTTAFAFEYPGLDFVFNNKAIPIAMVFGYYSKTFSSYLLNDPGKYLQQILIQGEEGAPNVSAPANAAKLLCTVVGIPNGVAQCSSFCPGPGPSGWSQYLAAVTPGSMSGMMIGKYLGGGASIAGAIIGAGISVASVAFSNYQYNQQCKNFGGISECQSGRCVA